MDLESAIHELRRLNQPVPTPLRLPTEAEVSAAERLLGSSVHQDYRRFLLGASDVVVGTLEPCVVVPGYGYLDLVDTAHRAWAAGLPADLLPICEDNGDYYCLDRSGGVRFWSHDGPAEEAWPDLASWIKDVWIAGGA